MMLHKWISTGAVVLLAAVTSVTVTTKTSIVEGFTTSPSLSTYRTASSQSYDRLLVTADASERPIHEKSMYNSAIGVSIFRHKATRIIAATIAMVAIVTFSPLDVWADGQTKDFKFPPIDYSDVNRCVLKGGSSMGQANAARDKLYDLRQCKLSGVDATGYDLSGVSTYPILFCTLFYFSNAHSDLTNENVQLFCHTRLSPSDLQS
jgi:hypothetical protein